MRRSVVQHICASGDTIATRLLIEEQRMKFSVRQLCMIVTLAAAFPAGFCAQAEQNSKTNKAIIYPTAHESIEQLRKQGVKKVDDYGSYWTVEATDGEFETLQKAYGDRVVKGNYLK